MQETDIGVESDALDSRPDSSRFRPGFGWGLAAGALLVVLIAVAGSATVAVVAMLRFPDSAAPSRTVVVSPAKAGRQWFSVGEDGTGTLQGWSTGAVGSGGGYSGDPSGSVGYLDVGQVDSEDGVRLVHTVSVHVTRDTELFIGAQEYSPGGGKTAAEALVGTESDFAGDLVQDRFLTVEFHVQGDNIVADKISTPLEMEASPLMEY